MARRLAKREKVLIVAAVTVGCLILIMPFARGFAKRYGASQTGLEQAQQRLVMAQMNRQTILEDRATREAIDTLLRTQPGPQDLFAYINLCANELNLQNRIEIADTSRSNQPKAVIVRVTLPQISLEEVVDLLHRVYSGNRLVTLNGLTHLRASRTGKGLECQLELKAPKA